MIINESCYRDVKEALDELRKKLKESSCDDGKLAHEIAIREKELCFYDAVISGREKLPNLAAFGKIGRDLLEARVFLGLSADELSKKCKAPGAGTISEVQIVGFELFDYMPASYESVLTIADALRIAAPSSNSNAEGISVSDGELQDLLMAWKNEIGLDIRSEGLVSSWKEKVRSIGPGQEIRPDFELIDGFANALIMWRLAKRWSYKQLAEQADLFWLELYRLEQNNFYNASYGTMLKLADIVEHGSHAPSDKSFDTDEALK